MNQTTLDFSYKSSLNFTTREEYLHFRVQWKADYFTQIKNIRKLKLDLKEAHRAGKHGTDIWKIMRAHREAVTEIKNMISDKYQAARRAEQQYQEAKANYHAA